MYWWFFFFISLSIFISLVLHCPFFFYFLICLFQSILLNKGTLFKIDHQSGVLQTEGGPEDFDRESFTNYTITFEVGVYFNNIPLYILTL